MNQDRHVLMVLVSVLGIPPGQLLLEVPDHGNELLGRRGELVRAPAAVLVLIDCAGLFPLRPEAEST